MPALVHIGRLTVSAQALTVAIAATVSAFVSMLVFSKHLSFAARSAVALGVLLSGFVTAYTVNCTVVGDCRIWAWVLASVFAFNVASMVAANAVLLMHGAHKHHGVAKKSGRKY